MTLIAHPELKRLFLDQIDKRKYVMLVAKNLSGNGKPEIMPMFVKDGNNGRRFILTADTAMELGFKISHKSPKYPYRIFYIYPKFTLKEKRIFDMVSVVCIIVYMMAIVDKIDNTIFTVIFAALVSIFILSSE